MLKNKLNSIIVSPSLNPEYTVSGISAVTNFIIDKNHDINYIHFEIGKKDSESPQLIERIKRIIRNYKDWNSVLNNNSNSIIHYNMPLMRGAIIRDFFFIRKSYIKNYPIILHIHGGFYMKERRRPWLFKKLLTYVFNRAKFIIVLSDEEKRIIEEDFKQNNVYTLPNCIDLSEARTFQRLYKPQSPISILYLGRIEKNKGIDYLIEATKILNKENIDFNLHFAGKEENENEYIPILKQNLGSKFIYHGVVYNESKIQLLKHCDIFLLPSFYEGLPMALIESMGYGEVPIVTNVGSISSIVEDNINGYFIQVKDSNDIVSKIKKLVDSPELLKKLSKAASNTIQAKYDEKKYISTLNSLYLACNKD